MKPSEAIRILSMFNDLTEVELIFPEASKVVIVKQPVKPMTEGAMANLDWGPGNNSKFGDN